MSNPLPQVLIPEVESSEEEEDEDTNKEEIEKLRKEIEEIKLRQEANFAAACDWQNRVDN